LLTGTFPNMTGIVDNDWFDRRSKRSVYCVEDPAYPLVGNPRPSDDEPAKKSSDGKGDAKKTPSKPKGISPRSLLAGTLGDVLNISDPKSKIFAVSLKDRAAVLMAGHTGDGVFWFDPDTGNWITSSYYSDSIPGYLRNFNESDAAEAYIGQKWSLLMEEEKYLKYPSPKGASLFKLMPGFPHVMARQPGPLYYKAMTVSPFGNQLTLDAARLIIASEHLGADDSPDLLCINLSSNDYVGHAFGPHSLEVQDITCWTDRQLAKFAAFVDEQLQGAPWVMALSSDHGVAPMPEYSADLRSQGTRNPLGNMSTLRDALEKRLREQLDTASSDYPYVLELDDKSVYLDHTSPNLRGERLITAQRVARDFMCEQPAVAVAFTREDLLAQNAPENSLATAFARSCHNQRSGDVLFAFRPYSIHGGTPATHGSPWEYDKHVPLLFWGSGIRPGTYNAAVTPASMAPTLARLLGVDAPSCCSVPALDEALVQSQPEVAVK
jgi:predicted AlkP superfamily pyrophosphatase or phosphodiesterase